MFSRVDFPHPEGPTTETNSPLATLKETSSSASKRPWDVEKDLRTFKISNIGVLFRRSRQPARGNYLSRAVYRRGHQPLGAPDVTAFERVWNGQLRVHALNRFQKLLVSNIRKTW